MYMKLLTLILVIMLLTACNAAVPQTITEIVQIKITTTPVPTQTSTTTPTLTPSPTASPTQTPTALPASIFGNPRSFTRLNPEKAFNAPCGFVDTLDFPLDPPHGNEASGGSDFGTYRQRYEKYHAGEDWGLRNVSNFGQPVYSIGHGQVTYAQPNGWGLDKGVIVIRHVFPNGRYILSFYGHLDPPSVSLKTGDCVERGDKIAEIGRPRTPPHLHFEIRLHLPNSTGHGYWSIDPTLAGWLSPSQTIHDHRVVVSPGVQWTSSYAGGEINFSGTYTETVLIVQNENIAALDSSSGKIQWQQTYGEASVAAVLDPDSRLFYHLDQMGLLSAHDITDPATAIWQTESGALTSAELIAPPTGGVIVTDRRQTTAYSRSGNQLWQLETKTAPSSWTTFQDMTILTIVGERPIWSVKNNEQPQNWEWKINGHLITAGNQTYLYAEEGIYQLDVENQTGIRVFQLPKGRLNLGRFSPLPNGEMILYHVDGDRRLMALNTDGTIHWERSTLNVLPRDVELTIQGGLVYLLSIDKGASGNEVRLFNVDMETGDLTHIFTGGTRLGYSRSTWIKPVKDDLLLINIGGGPLALINPQEALKIIEMQ
jgi:murein DD-endopeptidase MepM/ murein hydrolase activator NlpD